MRVVSPVGRKRASRRASVVGNSRDNYTRVGFRQYFDVNEYGTTYTTYLLVDDKRWSTDLDRKIRTPRTTTYSTYKVYHCSVTNEQKVNKFTLS